MQTVLEILLSRKGKANAITAGDLADRLNRDERHIRAEIRMLIAAGYPIASSTQPPSDYFMVQTHEEAEAYLASLKSRLVEDAYRRRGFKKAYTQARDGVKQLALL